MRLSDTQYDNAATGCCAQLNDAIWDEREVTWHNKMFLKDRIRTVLHVPINYGKVMTRANVSIETAEAYPERPLWLNDESSLWHSDLYLAVDHEVPEAETVTLSGTFITKVFEGPYKNAWRWTRAMREYVQSRWGRKVKRILFYYATCPKCAKHYGENKVVLFAEVE